MKKPGVGEAGIDDERVPGCSVAVGISGIVDDGEKAVAEVLADHDRELFLMHPHDGDEDLTRKGEVRPVELPPHDTGGFSEELPLRPDRFVRCGAAADLGGKLVAAP